MSQDKRCTLPSSGGQPENLFNLYGYCPQLSTNTVITEPLQKEGLSSQNEKNVHVGHVGNVYFPQPSQEAAHSGSQQGRSSVSVQNVVKTEQPVASLSFYTGSLSAPTPMSQPHTHPAQARPQHRDLSVTPSSFVTGQSQQSVTPKFTHISTVYPGYTSDSQSVSYHVGNTRLTSMSAPQAAQGTEPQSVGLNTTSKWQTEQLRPYLSANINQVGMSASGSMAAGNHVIDQQGSTQRKATEMSLPVSQPAISYSLIQQGLLANPLYSQGSVSSVGPAPHTQTQPLSNNPKPASSLSASIVQTFPQTGIGMESTQQTHVTLTGRNYSDSGKRKSSIPECDEDMLVCGNKQPRTASRALWNTGTSSNDSDPLTTTPMQIQLAPHISSNTNGGVNNSANSTSGFMDTFRSFVESSSQGAYSQENANEDCVPIQLVRDEPFSALSKKEGLSDGNMSQKKAATGSGFPEHHRSGEGHLDKLKNDPPQPQSQSFVEKMHATIFSLSEEVSSATGPGGSGQQSSLTMSSSSLASILKRVGRQDTSTDRYPQNVSSSSVKASEYPSSLNKDSSTLGQKTLHSSQVVQGAMKSEPEVEGASDLATDNDPHRSSASSHQHNSKVSDGSASSASESDSEMSSSNSKKRFKGGGAGAASKKMKIEDIEKAAAQLSATSPCASGSKKKKQPKADKQTSKGWAWDKPLVKVSLATLKRTGAPFLQNGPCTDLPLKVSKCRECRTAFSQENKDMPSIFCRFYAFRRLKYNPAKGTVMKAGFSELSDADPDLIEPWLPRFPIENPQLDKEMAKFILSKVGDKFCELVQQEKEAKALPGTDATVVWKRAVTGVREMCDVCETTIFNMHWVCSKCGYVVCLDCYKAKIKEQDCDGVQGAQGEASRKWQICTSSRYPHDANKLILTQIIPSDALWELGRMIHYIRRKWSIHATCPCGQNGSDVQSPHKTENSQSSVKNMLNGAGEEGAAGKSKVTPAPQLLKGDPEAQSVGSKASKGPQQDSGVKKEGSSGVAVKQEGGQGASQKLGGCTSLRELLTKTAGKGKVSLEKKPKPSGSSLNDIIQSVVEKSCRDLDTPTTTFKFLHYIPRSGQWTRELPIVTHSLTETSVLYPDVPHSWLCDGRLLRLHDPRHKGNLEIFQEQWKRGQPVMVSCVHKLMNVAQWKPEFFSQHFGHKKNDLVNCHNGDIIGDRPMRDFWDGFESIQNRLVDERGCDMMLKLKDWPPGDDFAELLPTHFEDLMAALPLPEYSQRDGKLNLASRLPDFLVRPDLGPKMYNAFGSAMFAKEGTTNLHLDISDAVNVLVYVGVPADGPLGKKEHEEAAVKAIDEAGCDSITKRRIREVHELPGALWQIYDAHDADKIRDFLNKVAKERGEEIEPNHDAIHDQSWYLDEDLRDRLLKEYGVQGYTIVQCLGDSIFIPAGAPHQVRNLHSCIKVAEDFVSPEHLNHCFRMTQEFRQLSETHSNHEDKLQVKNIVYHAVKDSIAVLRELEPEDKH